MPISILHYLYTRSKSLKTICICMYIVMYSVSILGTCKYFFKIHSLIVLKNFNCFYISLLTFDKGLSYNTKGSNREKKPVVQTKDDHLEIKFSNRNQVDDKLEWELS